MSNVLLVSGTGADDAPRGVSPALAAALADALKVPVQLIAFPEPGDLVEAFSMDVFDVANIGADPARTRHIAFTAPYSAIEATCLVRGTSPIIGFGDIDRSGVRIVSKRDTAYTLWLDRNISHAEVIHTDSTEESFQAFVDQELEALAGLRPKLVEDAEWVPGSRILEGNFTSIKQAIGVHRNRDEEGLSYLERFVEWAVDSDFVGGLIEHFGVKGLSVVPPPVR